MLIRITGASAGIAEYLQNGHKSDREYTRDELDERIILDGDLELTDTIINDMQKEGDRYLHITLAFKEDYLDRETLDNIVGEFKSFAMSAYDDDEYNFYAEAHLPKLKSYANRKTGELVERKPHIHIVIPKQNLLSGTSIDPLYKPFLNKTTQLTEVTPDQYKWIEAFQETINAKYGLASPKDNRRTEFTNESEMISRYKGDIFQGQAKVLKERVLSDVLDRNITDYNVFTQLLSEYGATRTRNQGGENEYLNVKPSDNGKGINLKDYVFSRAFIEMTADEKSQVLTTQARQHYEAQQPSRPAAPELAATLAEWHEVRARELKYINSGSRKLYAEYKAADRSGKIEILNARAERFMQKHRGESEHDRNDPSRLIADINANLGAASHNLESAGQRLGHTDEARRNFADRRNRAVIKALGERLGHDQTEDRPLAEPQPRDRRDVDNVIGQMVAEDRELKAEAKAASLSEFTQIKRELDASHLLERLSQTHGVIPDKYEISKGKDGGDRIRAGNRNLNVSDFLTQELRLSFSEAAPILRKAYAEQLAQQPIEQQKPPEPRIDLWQAYKDTQPDRAKQRAADWAAQRASEGERRAAIRKAYQAERLAIKADKNRTAAQRKAALSITRMQRIQADALLREQIKTERIQHNTASSDEYRNGYRNWLAELAQTGHQAALAELRRMQRKKKSGIHGQEIHAGAGQQNQGETETAPFLNSLDLTYHVHKDGAVTYRRGDTEILRDEGHAVKVLRSEDNNIETSLRLAQAKFGNTLTVHGTDEFKANAARVAAEKGLRVSFTDPKLNELMTARKVEIAQEREKVAQPTVTPKPPRVFNSIEPNTERSLYVGLVVSIDKKFVYQAHGNDFIRHDRSRFESLPELEEKIRIEYSRGQMKVELSNRGTRTRGPKL
ncbi:MAG: hypothetical protein EO766_16345 [Hydrotalea sp. AMD]|uniref:LPD7 domain-containing protein n=1 Tax=Hydrotalea sp. AMD TaxID=2501297 RepID=UPI0010276499|nr:LPD7 domain-containing protein [Hydrotalea sp. AMD]RWZ85637.1 MAG: hypothetical protein EO766_16345 [Hydrotalea sp. AMD]